MFRRVQSSTKLIRFNTKFPHTKSRSFHIQNFQKQCSKDVTTVTVQGESLEFPNVWLRENCQCEKCFHPSAKSRILDWSNFDVNVQPNIVQESENSVKITWNDGHISQFQHNWLKYRSFKPDDQKEYKEQIYKVPKVLWHGAEFQQVCSPHNYEEILQSDQAFYNWLHKVSAYGVALIENTPNSEFALDKIVSKIGFTKQTHYGVKFIVQNVMNTSNVAYLSSNLPLHVDLPYYEYCPGVNMLHCLVQTESKGGENLLTDGHYTADYMKKNHPKEYKLLTDIEVEWSDIGTEKGNEFFKLHRAPVICLDKSDCVTRINFSIPQRGSHFPCDINLVKPWYEAHSLFLNLSTKFAAKFKTKAGDILVFDNIRLLHGRNKYDDSSNNVRKIIGAYVDWDEIYSRLRCLHVRLNQNHGIY